MQEAIGTLHPVKSGRHSTATGVARSRRYGARNLATAHDLALGMANADTRRMGRGLAELVLALVLGTAGCDGVGSVEASTNPSCPPGACCEACCGVPATGTDAGRLPPRPKAPAETGNAPTVFAISKMYFGDTDRTGHPSDTAWTAYGLNIDGKVTSARSTNTCTLVWPSVCLQRLSLTWNAEAAV